MLPERNIGFSPQVLGTVWFTSAPTRDGPCRVANRQHGQPGRSFHRVPGRHGAGVL